MFYKKFLILALVAGLSLSAVPVVPARATGVTQETGRVIEVENEGNFITAYSRAQAGDTIVLKGDATINDEGGLGQPFIFDKAVTVQGGTLSVRAGGFVLGADVTFKNVTLGFANSDRNAIIANGYTLTLEGVSKSSGTRDIHLFTGSLTGYENVPGAGTSGIINLKGSTTVGNIYCGSLSDNGQANTWSGTSTVNVDNGFSGKIGSLYCTGAIKSVVDDTKWFDTNYEVPAPTAHESFVNSGATTVNTYSNKIANIDGKTGSVNTVTVNYEGGEYPQSISLSGGGDLNVNSGSLTGKGDLSTTKVSVKDSALFSVQGLGDINLNGLSGTGFLSMDANQSLSVSNLTGNLKVAIGGKNADDLSWSNPVEGHVYIKTTSEGANLTLLPYYTGVGGPTSLVFDSSKGGYKATSGGTQVEERMLLRSFAFVNSSMEGTAEGNYCIEIAASYDDKSLWDMLDFLTGEEVSITIDGSELSYDESSQSFTGSGKNGEVYTAYFTDPNLNVSIANKSDSVDSYEVKVVVGKDYISSGSAIIAVTNIVYKTSPVEDTVSITKQPVDVEVEQGSTATFTIEATGSKTLSYQWQYSDSSGWVNVSEGTDKVLKVSNGVEGTKYRCIVTSGNKSETSNEVTLTVKEKPAVTKIAIPTGKNLPWTGSSLSGVEENSAYKITGEATGTNVKVYTVILELTDKSKTTWSDNTVENKEVKWSIVKADRDMPDGITTEAQTSADGNGKLKGITVDMEYSGSDGVWHDGTGEDIEVDPGSYSVRYKATDTHNESSSITVTVSAYIKKSGVITSTLQDINAVDGNNVTVSITADNAVSYQWKLNGSPISGADSSTYSFTAEKAMNGSTLSCSVTGQDGIVVESNTASITVTEKPVVSNPVNITSQPTNVTVKSGEVIEVTVGAENAVNYEWYFGGSVVGTSNTLRIENASKDNEGAYYCRVYAADGTYVNSNTINVYLNEVSQEGSQTGGADQEGSGDSQTGGADQEGSGESQPGGAEQEGSGDSQTGGAAQEGSGDSQTGGAEQEGSGDSQTGGAAQEGSGDSQTGGAAQEGSGDSQTGGVAQEGSEDSQTGGAEQEGSGESQTGGTEQEGSGESQQGGATQEGESGGSQPGGAEQEGSGESQTGGAEQEGSGESQTGGTEQEGSGGSQTGGTEQEGSGESQTGGTDQEGSGESQTGGAEQEGSGDSQTGGAAQEGSGDSQTGGAEQEGSGDSQTGGAVSGNETGGTTPSVTLPVTPPVPQVHAVHYEEPEPAPVVVIPTVVNDYGYFLSESKKDIENLKPGEELLVQSEVWHSFPKSFFEEIRAKEDARVRIEVKYKGKWMMFIVDRKKLDNLTEEWYGPLKMAEIFGDSAITE